MIKWATQYSDGSFYFYAGDCGSSPHICWDLDSATLSEWEGENKVPVLVTRDLIPENVDERYKLSDEWAVAADFLEERGFESAAAELRRRSTYIRPPKTHVNFKCPICSENSVVENKSLVTCPICQCDHYREVENNGTS